MSRITVGGVALCLGAAVFTGTASGVITVSCDPSVAGPTGNDVIQVDCTIVTDASVSLNSYKITMPCAWTVDPGAGGSIDHLTIPATACTFVGTDDPACDFAGYQAACDGANICFSSAQCGGDPCVEDPNNPGVKFCEGSGTCVTPSPFIDTLRSDFVFLGQQPFLVDVDLGSCPGVDPFVLGTLPSGEGVDLIPSAACASDLDCPPFSPCVTPSFDPCPEDEPGCVCNARKYVGSFLYRVSACAEASFSVTIVGNSTPPMAPDASQVTDSADMLVQLAGDSAVVSVDVGLCCADGQSCLGDFNEYCCLNVEGGILAISTATCQGPSPDPCVCDEGEHSQCDDGTACTDDFCAPQNAASNEVGCINADNVPGGFCCDPTGEGPLDPINDGNPCTVDSCLNGVYPAVHDGPAADGQQCESDGIECTLDACLNGSCAHDVAGANGVGCTSDGNPCTLDVCDTGVCIHDAAATEGLACPGDGDFCTVDECSSGVCTHADINLMVCEALAECPSNASNCTGSGGNPGLCECTPPKGPCYGDIFPPGGNGTADIDDLLCLLSGFANFADCSAGDIFPCGGNGIIDIDDVVGGLNAFSGISNCEGVPPCS